MLDPLGKRAIRSLISLKKARTFRLNVQSKWRSVSSSIGWWTPVAAQWTNPERCGPRSCSERSSCSRPRSLVRSARHSEMANPSSVAIAFNCSAARFVAEIIRDYRSTRPREAE